MTDDGSWTFVTGVMRSEADGVFSHTEIWRCPECVALVDGRDRTEHADWHRRLRDAVNTAASPLQQLLGPKL